MTKWNTWALFDSKEWEETGQRKGDGLQQKVTGWGCKSGTDDLTNLNIDIVPESYDSMTVNQHKQISW